MDLHTSARSLWFVFTRVEKWVYKGHGNEHCCYEQVYCFACLIRWFLFCCCYCLLTFVNVLLIAKTEIQTTIMLWICMYISAFLLLQRHGHERSPHSWLLTLTASAACTILRMRIMVVVVTMMVVVVVAVVVLTIVVVAMQCVYKYEFACEGHPHQRPAVCHDDDDKHCCHGVDDAEKGGRGGGEE